MGQDFLDMQDLFHPVFVLLYQELIFQALALTCGAVITDTRMEEGHAAGDDGAAAVWAPQPFLQPFMQPGTVCPRSSGPF